MLINSIVHKACGFFCGLFRLHKLILHPSTKPVKVPYNSSLHHSYRKIIHKLIHIIHIIHNFSSFFPDLFPGKNAIFFSKIMCYNSYTYKSMR